MPCHRRISASLRGIVVLVDDAKGCVGADVAVGDDTGVGSLGIKRDFTPRIFSVVFIPVLCLVSS